YLVYNSIFNILTISYKRKKIEENMGIHMFIIGLMNEQLCKENVGIFDISLYKYKLAKFHDLGKLGEDPHLES
ncbi:hypothetical protein ACJX0J_017359, partial [Zea mays]